MNQGRVIGNLRAFIDVYRKDHGIPADEHLTFEEGKEAINLAIFDYTRRLENLTRGGKNSSSAEESREAIRILQDYQRSF